jgi:hypothetical protein
MQSGAQTQHITVPEDAENPCEQRNFGAVEELRTLRDDPADQRLRGGQPDRAGCGVQVRVKK